MIFQTHQKQQSATKHFYKRLLAKVFHVQRIDVCTAMEIA